ncbi:hypothetical protein Ahy_A07g032723 isoform A [Arachis hypogaea]|uniref:Uncharacterized protein n=1 Tax=Arachis hypogaea TaxID=3818 RepID=A0A445C7J6_ARAHY|nr:hypothetical protein Ahy_A07g032723 isoform A [Arachis hypogaea]
MSTPSSSKPATSSGLIFISLVIDNSEENASARWSRPIYTEQQEIHAVAFGGDAAAFCAGFGDTAVVVSAISDEHTELIKACHLFRSFPLMAMKKNAPARWSGLNHLYRAARDTCRRLVVFRVSNQRVLPWMVSSTGAIRNLLAAFQAFFECGGDLEMG